MPFIRSFTFSLLLVLAGYTAVKAQQTTPSAYIVTTSSDTLQGEVLKESPAKKLLQVRFKTQGGEIKTYLASEIKGYGLSNGLRFEARNVVVSENPQTIFLQVLVDGPTKLYYAHDFHPSYAYFLQRQLEPVVPLHKSYYTGTLSSLLQDCSSLSIQNYKYNNSSLANLTQAYNNCQFAEQESEILYQQVKTVVRWGIRAGATSFQMVFPFDDRPPYGHTASDWSTSVTAGVFVNFSFPGKPLSIQPELLYIPRQVSSSYTFNHPFAMDYENRVSLDAHYLQLPVLLKYTFGKGVWQPYLNAGLSYSLAFSNKLDHTITYESGHVTDLAPKIDNYSLGYVLGGGIQFNRLSLDARYSREIANSTELDNRIYFNTLQFGLGYTF